MSRILCSPVKPKDVTQPMEVDGSSQDEIVPLEDDSCCQVCFEPESFLDNTIVFCSQCNLAVHQLCYGVKEIPVDDWFCDACLYKNKTGCEARCFLCPVAGGALKYSRQFYHVICILWTRETFFTPNMTVMGIESIPRERISGLKCKICKLSGLCIQCSYGKCCTAYHPVCAYRSNEIQMKRLTCVDNTSAFCSFCNKHTPDPDADLVAPPDSKYIAGFPHLGRLSVEPNNSKAASFNFLPPPPAPIIPKPLIPSNSIISQQPVGCDICWENVDDMGTLLECNVCKVRVHSKCYGVIDEVVPWNCDRCVYNNLSLCVTRCTVCPFVEGAFKQTQPHALVPQSLQVGPSQYPFYDTGWIHLFCTLMLSSELSVVDSAILSPVVGLEKLDKEKFSRCCSICESLPGNFQKHAGVTIMCNAKNCKLSFHPRCAVKAGLRMETVEDPNANFVSILFCSKHVDSTPVFSGTDKKPSVVRIHVKAQGEEVVLVTTPVSTPVEEPVFKVEIEEPVVKNSRLNRQNKLTPVVNLARIQHLHSRISNKESDDVGDGYEYPVVDYSVNRSAYWNFIEPYFAPLPTVLTEISEPLLDSSFYLPPIPLEAICGSTLVHRKKLDFVIRDFVESKTSEISSAVFGEWENNGQLVKAYQVEPESTQKMVYSSDILNDEVGIELQKLQSKLLELIFTSNSLRSNLRKDRLNQTYLEEQSREESKLIYSYKTFSRLQIIRQCLTAGVKDAKYVPKIKSNDNEEEEETVCCVCFWGSSNELNPIIYCDTCNISVHKACYGVLTIPDDEWNCDVCAKKKSVYSKEKCIFCPVEGGALKRTEDGHFGHIVCVLWNKDIRLRNVETMSPIERVAFAFENQEKLGDGGICSVCKSITIPCCEPHCNFRIHPLCAWYNGNYMSVLASGDQLSYRPYCEVHSRSDHIARSEFAAPCDSNSGVIIPTERSMEQQREIRHRGRADQLAIRNSVGLGKKSKGEDQYEEGKCAVCFTKDQVADVSLESADSDIVHTNASTLIRCCKCGIDVHKSCYGVAEEMISNDWNCRKCEKRGLKRIDCALCPRKGGAFKPTVDGRWVHVSCALWIPEVCFVDNIAMEPVAGLSKVPRDRSTMICYICRNPTGPCISCTYEGSHFCYMAFHPLCGLQSGAYMKIIGENFISLCKLHTPIHKIQNSGGVRVPPEYNLLLRLRRDLDKARMLIDLCRRRERVKKNLLVSQTSIFEETKTAALEKFHLKCSESLVKFETIGKKRKKSIQNNIDEDVENIDKNRLPPSKEEKNRGKKAEPTSSSKSKHQDSKASEVKSHGKKSGKKSGSKPIEMEIETLPVPNGTPSKKKSNSSAKVKSKLIETEVLSAKATLEPPPSKKSKKNPVKESNQSTLNFENVPVTPDLKGKSKISKSKTDVKSSNHSPVTVSRSKTDPKVKKSKKISEKEIVLPEEIVKAPKSKAKLPKISKKREMFKALKLDDQASKYLSKQAIKPVSEPPGKIDESEPIQVNDRVVVFSGSPGTVSLGNVLKISEGSYLVHCYGWAERYDSWYEDENILRQSIYEFDQEQPTK